MCSRISIYDMFSDDFKIVQISLVLSTEVLVANYVATILVLQISLNNLTSRQCRINIG